MNAAHNLPQVSHSNVIVARSSFNAVLPRLRVDATQKHWLDLLCTVLFGDLKRLCTFLVRIPQPDCLALRGRYVPFIVGVTFDADTQTENAAASNRSV